MLKNNTISGDPVYSGNLRSEGFFFDIFVVILDCWH